MLNCISMSSMKQIAECIPSEYRQKIILEWLPAAKATMGNDAFKALWEAYFNWIDPNGVKKSNCPICLQNVLDNWKSLAPYLVEAEKEFNALEQI
jgi:hypothetical protein